MKPVSILVVRFDIIRVLTFMVCASVETVVFFISVLVVTYVVQDGKSNYLEGAMLFGLYVIIAVAFYATPSDAFGNSVNAALALVRLK